MLPARFWNKVNKHGPVPAHRPKLGPCHLWLGSKTKNGYGQWMPSGRRVPQLTHVAVYEDSSGPVPDGLELDHLCRVRHCCNRAHVEAVTRHENIMRGVRVNLLKTHCPQGHVYSAENVYVQSTASGTTSRKCRVCMTLAVQRHRRRRRQEEASA
jgi:HNH endonuclease